MKPHKHAELIKAWADGAEIEWVGATKYDGTKLWSVVANPPWNESHEYRIKPEPKPDVPDGLIDPKSYYQGYEDGKNDYLKKSPIGWIDELGTFVSASDYKELHEKLKEDMKPLYDMQEPKPDVVMEYLVDDMGTILLTHKNPKLKLTFDGETGELKSAELLK